MSEFQSPTPQQPQQAPQVPQVPQVPPFQQAPPPQATPAPPFQQAPPPPQAPQFQQAPQGSGSGSGSASPRTAAPRAGRTFGWPALVACTLAAAVLGGTASAGAITALTATGTDTDTAGSASEAQIEQASLPGADADVASAAAIASPSVVTLGVSAGSAGGSGSGIILDQEGHVLTNTHVVTLGGASSEAQITVQLDDGTSTSAQIVGTDPLSDLAVIKLDNAAELDLSPATFGSSGDLQVGDEAIAIGAPLGLSGTVTTGIISTLDRTITVASSAVDEPSSDQASDESERFEFRTPDNLPRGTSSSSAGSIFLNVIQTDASINQGNSGGALVDASGQIIGINVAIASTGESAGSIGVGFAIPGDYAQRIAEDLISSGEASHGLLGVLAADASPDAEVNEAIISGAGQTVSSGSFTAGALVTEVETGSPADEAGLEPGDVITAVEGRHISDSQSLTAVIREYAADQEVELGLERGGEDITIRATLGAAS